MLDQSRWTRDPADLEALRATLTAANVALMPLSAPLDQESPEGQLVSRVTLAADRYTIDVARAKTVASLQQRAEAGHYHGQVPLGYRRPRDARGHVVPDAPIEIDPPAAEIVRQVFELWVRGHTMAAIARRLNAAGVRGQRGPTSWGVSHIAKILHSEVHVGRVPYNGRSYAGLHEPIIDDLTWARAQQRLARLPEQERGRGSTTLAALMICGVCGGSVHRTRCGRATSYAYRCGARIRRPASDRHAPIHKSVDAVEACLWAWTESLLSGVLLRAALDEPSEVPDLDVLEAQLRALDEQVRYNLHAARAGGLPADLLAAENAPLLERREVILRRLRAPRSEAAGEFVLPDDPAAWVTAVRSLDLAEQVEILRGFYRAVALCADHLIVQHNIPGLGPRKIEYPRWRGPVLGWAPVDLSAADD